MKVTLSKKALPRDWSHHRHMRNLLHEADISVGSSKLKAKLLVFGTRKDMRHFWNSVMKDDKIDLKTIGVVNALGVERIKIGADGKESSPRMECDPHYFCMIALSARDLCFELIAHESVHAAFCYTKRVTHRNMWAKLHDFDEEHLCYPTGRIASEINRSLHRAGMYELSFKISRT